MITEEVIKDIYKKFSKRSKEDLNLGYFLDILRKHHDIEEDDDEIIILDLDEFSPFRRFLKRAVNAVLEFDRMIAFVFPNHILFFGKDDDSMRVHFKPEPDKRSFLDRIFGNQ